MSIILAAISKKGDIAVCADGRSTDKNKRVVNEHECKIFKINKRCIIGGTGTAKKFIKVKDYIKNNFSSDKYNVDQINKACLNFLEENKSDESEIHFLVAGFDEKCEPHLYVISASSTIWYRDYNDINKTILGDISCNFVPDENEEDINKLLDYMEKCIADRTLINFLINKNVRKLHLLKEDAQSIFSLGQKMPQ